MSELLELNIVEPSAEAISSVEETLVAETTSEDVVRRIFELKETLRDKVVILGHHYQRDDIVQFADRTGDSFELARFASAGGDASANAGGDASANAGGDASTTAAEDGHSTREFIIFCGVHFMAETADVLSGPNQKVILPDLKAGCSMSDMARPEQVYDAWEDIGQYIDTEKVCPVTYMNSSAAIKAFCGEHGGTVSTSSNNRKIFQWAFDRGFEKIFFFPDQHLGRNTAYFQMGIPLEEIKLYDQTKPLGGLTPEELQQAKILLWRGHCSVHQHFQASHPNIMRALYPGIQVLVHPECNFDVVRQADKVGSTSFIMKTVEQAPPESKWAIGTEHHLVNRLKKEHPEQFITTLAPYACECATMFRISPESLLDILENLKNGVVKNQIVVDDSEKRWAKIALDRMLEITLA
ncbi:MAG TPA: quinolinate synthase NadA [Candidatus Kapabacteria bacterium]|jgi:quinolinate synthase|nr:quinolinate synthase NadA [Candidatus Kapabacteria bacterium]